MSIYDVEREKQKSGEIRVAFREMFPLAPEESLPWAVSHIKDFLRNRIKQEFEDGTRHFISSVVKIICEVAPPKTHLVDMVRIAVDEVQAGRREIEKLKESCKTNLVIKKNLADQISRLNEQLAAAQPAVLGEKVRAVEEETRGIIRNAAFAWLTANKGHPQHDPVREALIKTARFGDPAYGMKTPE